MVGRDEDHGMKRISFRNRIWLGPGFVSAARYGQSGIIVLLTAAVETLDQHFGQNADLS